MKLRNEDFPAGLDRWCQALDWYGTLQKADPKELTAVVGRDWQAWYSIPENRCVFDAVSRLMAARALYRRARRPSVVRSRGDTYDLSVSIAEWRRAEAKRSKSRHHLRIRPWWGTRRGLGIGAIALVLVLGLLRLERDRGTMRPVTYETPGGNTETVDLSDGSRLLLGQQSRLTVAYSAQYRRVRLIKGEAWFKVEHDAHRPFIVSAGDGTITDVGTEFLVTRVSDRVLIAVTDGEVEVSARPHLWRHFRKEIGLAAGPAPAHVAVTGGEQVIVSNSGVLGPITRTAARRGHPCACGPIIFDNESLETVIRAVDRYLPFPIVVDPSLQSLRLSGVTFPDELTEWLRSLQRVLPIDVVDRGRYIRITPRLSKSTPMSPVRAPRM